MLAGLGQDSKLNRGRGHLAGLGGRLMKRRLGRPHAIARPIDLATALATGVPLVNVSMVLGSR